MIEGIVFNIVRGSLNDGVGIRTVVYLKGCNLRCEWCHNPEGHNFSPEVLFYEHLCVGCGKCVKVCPAGCFSIKNGKTLYDGNNCRKCFMCSENCPVNAIIKYGKTYTPHALFEEITKEEPFFKATGGGVTFSGGECLLQPLFLIETLRLCKDGGINTAVESALCVPWRVIEDTAAYTDMFFADLKHTEAKKHFNGTGADNALILQNLRRLSEFHKNICIRTPLIPGFNDDEKSLQDIADFVNSLGAGVRGYELLKYNNLAENKYKAKNMQNLYINAVPQTDEKMKEYKQFMRAHIKSDIKIF